MRPERLVMSFHVFRCRPSRYETLSALDANGTVLVVETLKLAHEGWARGILRLCLLREADLA